VIFGTTGGVIEAAVRTTYEWLTGEELKDVEFAEMRGVKGIRVIKKMNNIVIIGGGIAAVTAVKAIREIDRDVAIDLFGEEKYYPYYRLRLSKSLFDGPDEDGVLLQKKEWYAINKVNLHLNVRVQGVDIDRQEIRLPQGKRMGYGKLLLANGAKNRPPAVPGVVDSGKMNTIRSLEDVQNLRGKLAGKNEVFYIGGGVLGLEIAWILQQHHKQVNIAEIQNRLFPNQLDERAAMILKEAVESFGVKVLINTEVVRITGDQRVNGIETKDGSRFPCQMVLYATGIEPNIEILDGTPLKTHRGVLVDNKMQTNITNVYAAGDVAEYDGKVYGLWNIAAGQGRTAGYNMAGQVTAYHSAVPVTALNAYGTSLFSIGDVSETSATRTLKDEDRARNTYRRIFIKNNHMIGAILIGDTSKSPLLKTAIEKKLPLDKIDCDPTIDGILEWLKIPKD
jgi:nitrite reductase (NADH) large subunit